MKTLIIFLYKIAKSFFFIPFIVLGELNKTFSNSVREVFDYMKENFFEVFYQMAPNFDDWFNWAYLKVISTIK